MPLNPGAIGKKVGPLTKQYGWKDIVTYAVGVGAGFEDLEYAYESKLKVLPGFILSNIIDLMFEAVALAEINPAGGVHGEQDLIIHNVMPTEGALTTEAKIANVYDLGPSKAGTVVIESETYHSNGQKLYTSINTSIDRLGGGFGGSPPPKETFVLPARPPDFCEDAQPAANQPLIYRLSGDYYALHVDPDFAKMAGFERPTMHGLCTHGYAMRAVIKHLFAGEPERLKRFRNRFSRALYPGDPIKTQIWQVAEGAAYFRTINTRTGEVVIDRGRAEWL